MGSTNGGGGSTNCATIPPAARMSGPSFLGQSDVDTGQRPAFGSSRDQPLSFSSNSTTPIFLQAYDFGELARRVINARLQIGGSDQWGNIVAGVDLARRGARVLSLFGLTTAADHDRLRRQDGARRPRGARPG